MTSQGRGRPKAGNKANVTLAAATPDLTTEEPGQVEEMGSTERLFALLMQRSDEQLRAMAAQQAAAEARHNDAMARIPATLGR